MNEELLAKGITKLYKPSHSGETASAAKKGTKVASTTGDSNLGAREGSIRRVLLVRDRRTDESLCFGFAEFATVEVMADYPRPPLRNSMLVINISLWCFK